MKLFKNTIQGIDLRISDASGRSRTEHLSNRGQVVELGASATATVRLESGRFIAPSHAAISFDAYSAFIQPLVEGFPLICDGRLAGVGEKLPLHEHVVIGNTEIKVFPCYNKDGFWKKTAAFGAALLVLLVLFIAGSMQILSRTAEFHALVFKATTTSHFEKQIALFTEAHQIVQNSDIMTWVVNQSDYDKAVAEALSKQYLTTRTDSLMERKALLLKAVALDVKIPQLDMLCRAEDWVAGHVKARAVDSLPVFSDKNELRELHPTSALCKEIVATIDECIKLRTSRQFEEASFLMKDCSALNSTDPFMRFFRPHLLHLYSNLLTHLYPDGSPIAPDEQYTRYDPEFKYASASYLKGLAQYFLLELDVDGLDKLLKHHPNNKFISDKMEEVMQQIQAETHTTSPF